MDRTRGPRERFGAAFGAKSGEAYGSAAPSQSQDPTAAAQCNGEGLREFKLDGRLQTMSPLSG